MTSFRASLLCSLATASTLTACKARDTSGSGVRSGQPPEGQGPLASAETPEQLRALRDEAAEEWLQRLEAEVNVGVEALVFGLPVGPAGRDGPSGGSDAYALTGEEPMPDRKELERLATELDKLSSDDIRQDLNKAKRMSVELQALAQVVDGVKSDDQKRVTAIVAKVKKAIAEGPVINDDAELFCKDLGNQSWLPAFRNGGKTIGHAGQEGGKGFMTKSNCENSVKGKKNGLVCSVDKTGHISATYLVDNRQLPRKGYQQTANCIRAIYLSTKTRLCHVDNDVTGDNFAQYDTATGKATAWWFETVDRCMADKKGPSLATRQAAARARCEEAKTDCLKWAKLYSTETKVQLEELKCTNEYLLCDLKVDRLGDN